MIVDTSALVAVLRHEATREAVLDALTQHQGEASMSTVTYVELGIVVDRWRQPVTSRAVDELLHQFDVELIGFDAKHAVVARQAYRDFGKGSGHPAQLNFGDCFSYALAATRLEPLLFVGQDFTHTDIRSVL